MIDQGPGLGSFAFGEESGRVICWCTSNGIYAIIYIRKAAGVTYFCYAYGDDGAWTEEVLVRSDNNTGRLGIQATVEGFALDVHQTGGANDQVHIAWNAGGIIYHSELVVPNVPNNNGNWTAWAGFRYQRVDNNAAIIGYYAPAIQVDAAGDPHITYGNSAASEFACYNYGNGVNHAFVPASEVTLSAGVASAVNPTILAIPEVVAGGRDLYVFWLNGTIVEYRFCASANSPLVLVNWTAAATIITLINNAVAVSAAYWYEPGAALAQILVGAYDAGIGADLKTNRYDEGNIYGWGGGWRAAPGGTPEVRAVSKMQITQVSANDFALTQILAGVAQFSFTNLGGATHDFLGQTVYDCTNSFPVEIAAEMRGREHGDFSYGLLHSQPGATLDYMFDLVRINAQPSTSSLDPDNGDREDEAQAITLSWSFDDPGDAQTKRRVQVDEFGGDFSAPDYDSGEQAGAAANWDIPALTLVFSTHYEWRVKVWDDEVGTEYDPYSESSWEG